MICVMMTAELRLAIYSAQKKLRKLITKYF